jgi:hypothetical protein
MIRTSKSQVCFRRSDWQRGVVCLDTPYPSMDVSRAKGPYSGQATKIDVTMIHVYST